jgi:hypothetical protein
MTRFAVFFAVTSVAVMMTGPVIAGPETTSGQVEVPMIAVHIAEHVSRNCEELPVIEETSLRTTYDGVGQIDAYVVLFRFKEAKGISFALTWPEAWGKGTWHDCSHLKIADITSPGDVTSLVWKDCVTDSLPMIVGWITLTVNSPGIIEVLPAPKEGAIAIADCNEIAVEMYEAIVSLKAGAGGAGGDDPTLLHQIRNRNWYVGFDSATGAPSINTAMRQALPGDTVFVAGGMYRESVSLRTGVVVLGSWDEDFKVRDIERTPSIISPFADDEAEHDEGAHHDVAYHNAVRASFGEDSTAVLDGFIITGGSGKFGGGIALRNGASPLLRNLIIHSNTAQFGGGIACHSASPVIRNVLIARNKAETGGGIFCSTGSSPQIANVTIADNEAENGAGICVIRGSSPYIENSIIAYHADGTAIYNSDPGSRTSLTCCDLWMNMPTDFSAGADKMAILRDNLADNPQFTDPDNMDYTLRPASPALSSSGCGRMGSKVGRIPAE